MAAGLDADADADADAALALAMGVDGDVDDEAAYAGVDGYADGCVDVDVVDMRVGVEKLLLLLPKLLLPKLLLPKLLGVGWLLMLSSAAASRSSSSCNCRASSASRSMAPRSSARHGAMHRVRLPGTAPGTTRKEEGRQGLAARHAPLAPSAAKPAVC